MGHTEMLLAVAGLNQEQIEQRTGSMASGDWAGFSLAEQAAFAFARKQAISPADITPADIGQLTEKLGRERALDAIWWSSRCHFMTRVADAFQLPLEKENVFERQTDEKGPASSPKPSESTRLPDDVRGK